MSSPIPFADRARSTLVGIVAGAIASKIQVGDVKGAYAIAEELAKAAEEDDLDTYLLNNVGWFEGESSGVQKPSKTKAEAWKVLQRYIEKDCESSFEEFLAAMVVLQWFENLDKWESFQDISDEDATRAWKGRQLIATTIQRLRTATGDEDNETEDETEGKLLE